MSTATIALTALVALGIPAAFVLLLLAKLAERDDEIRDPPRTIGNVYDLGRRRR